MTSNSPKTPRARELGAFAADVAQVLLLRSSRICAGGPEGKAEARLMVTEKIDAVIKVQLNLLTGAYGLTPRAMAINVGSFYARAVRANRKRLTQLVRT